MGGIGGRRQNYSVSLVILRYSAPTPSCLLCPRDTFFSRGQKIALLPSRTILPLMKIFMPLLLKMEFTLMKKILDTPLHMFAHYFLAQNEYHNWSVLLIPIILAFSKLRIYDILFLFSILFYFIKMIFCYLKFFFIIFEY